MPIRDNRRDNRSVNRVDRRRSDWSLRIGGFVLVALVLTLAALFEMGVVLDTASLDGSNSFEERLEEVFVNPNVILAVPKAGSPEGVVDKVPTSLPVTEAVAPNLVHPSTTPITTSVADLTSSASSTVTAAATTTTTANTSGAIQKDREPKAPNGADGAWRLVFSDEFQTLDRDVWHTSYEWHPVVINDELQYYSEDHVSVDDGSLILTASETPQGGLPYSSGMISSRDRFSFTYGRIEMRGILPTGQGFWPAFWLMPADHSWPPEIDIMEFKGQETATVSCAFHWIEDSDLHSYAQLLSGPDYTAGFHTFALEWEPDKLTWFVDGKPCATYTDASRVPQKAMYVIANLAVGGAYVGPPDSTTPFPGTYVIDYIRVWQREVSG